MNKDTEYNINLDIKYDYLEEINIPQLVHLCRDKWYNQALCRVNDSVVRLGVVQGEFHWHKHDADDEFFLVLDGELLLDIEDKTFVLTKHRCCTVPMGVMHRTRAENKTVILMIERTGVSPTGD
ncbi:cupin domain-containing protein [candidate division KSB1 bacterium]